MHLIISYFSFQINLILFFGICLILQMQDTVKEKKSGSQYDVEDTVVDSRFVRKSKTLEDNESVINEGSDDDENDENNEIQK